MTYKKPTADEMAIAVQCIKLREKYTIETCAKMLDVGINKLGTILFRYEQYLAIEQPGKNNMERTYEPLYASFTEIVAAMRGDGVKPQPVINSLNPEHFIKAEERFPFLKVGLSSKV